jgi:hypothetical protein
LHWNLVGAAPDVLADLLFDHFIIR